MDLARARELTDANQARAADPEASAWVSANAGTGKTHVLVNRILRLLLAGSAPESILCLTYTRAAAAEMQNRLFRELGGWATMPAKELTDALAALSSAPVDARHVQTARRLFARTIETRGGLKIHTIHAFCERLLHRFPLEAGVPADFAVLDEREASTLLQGAVDHVLARAASWEEEGLQLHSALMQMISLSTELSFREVIENALAAGTGRDAQEELASLRQDLGLRAGRDDNAVLQDQANVLDDTMIDTALGQLDTGKATDVRTATGLRKARASTDPIGRAGGFRAAFLKGDGAPFATLFTKAVSEAGPALAQDIEDARDRFVALECERQALGLFAANAALSELVSAISDAYAARKAARAALDYDDLIARSAALLTSGGATDWVLYKLDGGIDHILVDEAQDTSPRQWRIIRALAQEFFAGAGAREGLRTVFAVGDQKQSIYSFQGAVPAEFIAQGRNFRSWVEASGQTWHQVPLNLSFRSTKAVLDAVDTVFAQPAAAAGLSHAGTEGASEIVHSAVRAGQAGRVEVWPLQDIDPPAPVAAFDPLGDLDAPGEASVALAARIADTIAGWIDRGERLSSQDRPIVPGDIAILVRRRRPFARAMIRALKARGLPVAGADRMRLGEQIAVLDLVALGDFLLTPDDDLALAALLKSPLADCDDDDLFTIAHGRTGSLWRALRSRSETDARFTPIVDWLRGLLAEVDFRPPFELFSGVLEENGMARRQRFLERLGPEAAEAIDAFLSRALAFEQRAPATLQGFLHDMRSGDEEIKRDMEQGRNEVRVMTVHGAKGLEADIVFLPDTTGKIAGAGGGRILMRENDGGILWQPPGLGAVPIVGNLKAVARQAEEEEYHRLLYVAMTRARDRLYVCGWKRKTEPPAHCWYNLVREALEPRWEAATDDAGNPVWRLDTRQTSAPGAAPEPEADGDVVALPDWARRPVDDLAPAAVAVTPSAAFAASDDAQTVDSPLTLTDTRRFARGRVIHALLQYLPDMAPGRWRQAASAFVAARGDELPAGQHEAVVEETLTLLEMPDFAALFGPESRAEVPIVARLPSARPGAAPIEVSGQIDRLALLPDEVLIVDYKTNRPPPTDVGDVAPGYLAQMALYRETLRRLYPEKPVRAALLWTATPHLMALPADLLDSHAARLGIAAMRPLDASRTPT